MMPILRINIMKEIGWMDVIDDKDSDERNQIYKNDEERVTDDIEVLKQAKFSSQKYTDNIEKEYDERNRMDMIDNKYLMKKIR